MRAAAPRSGNADDEAGFDESAFTALGRAHREPDALISGGGCVRIQSSFLNIVVEVRIFPPILASEWNLPHLRDPSTPTVDMANTLAVPVEYVPAHATSSLFTSLRQRHLPTANDWQHNEFSFEPFVKRELGIRLSTGTS